MALNKNCRLFSCNGELTKNNNCGDTTLRLDCLGYEGSKRSGFGNTQTMPGHRLIPSSAPDDGCRLVLGLGPTPSTYCDNYYPVGAGKGKELTTMLHQGLSKGDSILKLGLFGATEEFSGVIEHSVSTQSHPNPPHHTDQVAVDSNGVVIPVVDEGSTTAKKSGGYMPLLLMAPRTSGGKILLQTDLLDHGTNSPSGPSQLSSDPSSVSDYSMSTSTSTFTDPATAGTSSDHRTSNPKKCKFVGCTKGARGGTGFCIGHGGGQRCQKPGCNKGAESRTAYCKAHGGGMRCQYLGCTKSAEGRTDYCIAHGGGKRCGHPGPGGCNKAARGKSGLCIKHGGGKRCKVDGCCRSAEGQIGLCISHGGGRRCQYYEGCSKGAQGSTMFCKAHGGGKRCIFAGCTKGAEGSTPLCKGHGGGKRCLFEGGGICPKSVHGGTNFCVAHGGGKRCVVPGCTKSARGRTDCCVRHGGGKRCKFENCGKSAQGSTDFCKSHGGGKRCNWGEGKCEKFARGKRGLCAAHSSLVQERDTNKRCMIGPGLFHGVVSAASTVVTSYDNTYCSSGASVVSEYVDSFDKTVKRRRLIPPQVLVPLSMKSSSPYSKLLSSGKHEEGSSGGGIDISRVRKGFDIEILEGRVHGGGLLSLLGGNLKNAIDRI